MHVLIYQSYNSWSSYTTEALVDDVKKLLLDRYKYPSTVIVAHSYGCSIATNVSAAPELKESLKGLVLIAPKDHMDDSQKKSQNMLHWIPDWIFNCARTADRKGGLNSKSVDRFLGNEASIALRRR
jgi:predicted alpha/beta hydrolase family esterase